MSALVEVISKAIDAASMFWQTLGFGERYWLVCVGYLLFAVAFTITRALWRRRPVVYVPAIYPETLPREGPEVA